MTQTITVRTFPRIHVTLIDLAGVTQRRFGGAGFSVDTMPVVLSVCRAPANRVDVSLPVRERDRADLEGHLTRLSAAMGACFCVEVQSMMPQHVGLGSKTALLLAMGLACNAMAEGQLDQTELVRISRRGGASGVGVNATFTGGFVVDGGRKATGARADFRPSSAAGVGALPPLLVRCDFPAAWRVHLFMPRGTRYCGNAEEAFFAANTPVDSREVYEVLAAVYHGVAPAVAEADLHALRTALGELHTVGFKRREVERQSDSVRGLLGRLSRDRGVAAGMSSLGPLVYAIRETDDAEISYMSALGGPEVEYLGCAGGRNGGYELGGDE